MARSHIEIQKAVIFALFVRELKSRFGQYRLGYAWALIEPMAHIVVIAAIWTARGREDFFGVPIAMYLMTGIVPFLFFTNTSKKCINAIDANRALFTYKQVRPFDTVIARLILESIITFLSYLALLFIGFWILDYDVSIHDPLRFIGINALLFLLTFGVSITLAVYGVFYAEAMKVVPLFLFRLMYFTSGVLFPLSIIPHQFHELMLWNPMLHVIELNHLYYFRSFVTYGVNEYYVLLFAIGITSFGMLSYRRHWVKMIST